MVQYFQKAEGSDIMPLTKKQLRIYLVIFAALFAVLAVVYYVEQRNAPGGYPQLFYGGQYYTGAYDVERTLDQGWTQCGTVTEELPWRKKPKRDGQCNWLPAGSPIYANPAEANVLYVMTTNGRYQRYAVKS